MRNNNNALKQSHCINSCMSKLKLAMYPTFLILFFIMGILEVSWGQCDAPMVVGTPTQPTCLIPTGSVELNWQLKWKLDY